MVLYIVADRLYEIGLCVCTQPSALSPKTRLQRKNGNVVYSSTFEKTDICIPYNMHMPSGWFWNIPKMLQDISKSFQFGLFIIIILINVYLFKECM